MKIIFARTYENVQFQGKYQNHFSEDARPGHAAVSITLHEEINCIEVNSSTDSALIPLVNIAFMKLDSPLAETKRAEAAAEEAKPKNNPVLNTVKKPR